MAAEQSDTAKHTERAKAWLQNWEVKNWFDEESGKTYILRNDDGRLSCPSCVLKGYRITVSKEFVHSRNTERLGDE